VIAGEETVLEDLNALYDIVKDVYEDMEGDAEDENDED
jgi:hypothetical protein